MKRTDGDRPAGSPTTADDPPDIDDVFEELEELAELVDSPDERKQVMETMQTLRRSRSGRLVGHLRDTFDSRDVGEALVGSFVFGIPMVVEEGTLEVGAHIATHPLLLGVTLAFGATLVYGILHAVEFERIREDMLFGVVSVRLVTIPLLATAMGFGLMTAWGRVDWGTPLIAAGQCLVTSTVMAVGASLGDVLPG
ncbi:hypothetical protein [Haloplanus salilacus]|uniref:hypothetical protein n=1 Tax=Haloplanus salilacus TaxID=2949994 RepID=UPI0030CDEA6A